MGGGWSDEGKRRQQFLQCIIIETDITQFDKAWNENHNK